MKDIIKKFISNRGKRLEITQTEFNEFITETFYLFRNKYPTSDELNKIQAAFQFGYFSLENTIENIISNAEKFGFSITTIINKNGNIIGTIIK